MITEARKTRGIIRRDTRANQPAATDVLFGTIYYVTDEGVIERSNGLVWESFSSGATLPIAQSDVTNLVSDLFAINSSLGTKLSAPVAQADVTGLIADLASKLVSPVNLTSQVSNVLPTANGGNSVNIASTPLPLGSGQITFPAVQNASADANTLDDYEEGIWTPSISFGGASVGITYGLQNGAYTKIGRQVVLTGVIVLSNKGSSSGGCSIIGIPFATPNNNAFYSASAAYFANFVSTISNIIFQSPINSNEIIPGNGAGGGNTRLVETDFNNNSVLIMHATYFTF